MARPISTSYSDEERDEICAHILVNLAAGRPVTTILRDDEGMCTDSTFWRWFYADEELRGKVAQAREHGVEAMMEQARHVAATPMRGEIITEEPVVVDGKVVEGVTIRKVKSEDMLGHRKLLVDTLHKQAQMLKPKTYGPKLDLTSGGEKIGLAEAIEAGRKRVAEGGNEQA